MFVNEVVGPESFDSYNGELYTGVHGGYMIKLEEDRIVPIVKFGKKCGKSDTRILFFNLLSKFFQIFILFIILYYNSLYICVHTQCCKYEHIKLTQKIALTRLRL